MSEPDNEAMKNPVTLVYVALFAAVLILVIDYQIKQGIIREGQRARGEAKMLRAQLAEHYERGWEHEQEACTVDHRSDSIFGVSDRAVSRDSASVETTADDDAPDQDGIGAAE